MIETVLAGDGVSTPLWIDVCEPTPDELARISREHGIPPASLDACTAPLHLPKHERLGPTTFVITRVHDEESRPDADGFLEMTRKLSLFLGDRFLVTIHRRRLPFLEEIKQRIAKSEQPVFLQVVMLEIMLAGVETLHGPLEEAELRIHGFEAGLLDATGTTPAQVAWRDVFRTKVRIQTFRRLLWHIQNATQKFVPRSAVNQALADDLRERITSLSFLAEGLDSDLDTLLDVQLSLAANRTNDVMRLLTLFSAVFLPITFIVGVYGMNFRYMPELESHYGYVGVWTLIGVTVVAVVTWFRRSGWMR
jgi:magnesium transporter